MKRIISIIFVLLISMIFFSPLSVLGQDEKHYVVPKLGVYIPTGDLDDAGFDTGFNGEIVYGYRLSPYFALEGGVGYFQSDAKVSGSFTDPVLGTVSGSAELDLWAIPVTLTAKGIYPLGNVEFFAGGGVGVYFVNLDLKASGMISGGALGTISGSVSGDDDDTIFGGHIVFGIDFNISPNMVYGIEGKYLITDDAEFFGAKFSELNGLIATLKIGIKF